MQELEPAVGEQLVNLWSQSTVTVRPLSTSGFPSQVLTSGYNPVPFLATDGPTGPRPQYSMQQSGNWVATHQRPAYNPWSAGSQSRQQGYLGNAYMPVDYGMQQYAYAVQHSTQIPNVVHPTTASQSHIAGSGSNSAVMLLQRSAGSGSESGPRPQGAL